MAKENKKEVSFVEVTDVATQLAGGQNPWLILLLQGGQVKDSFGGI